MLATRTGNFPIGIRRGWTDWQKDVPALISFAKSHGFACVDLNQDLDAAKAIVDAGLSIGSVDAFSRELMSPEEESRIAAVESLAGVIATYAPLGVRNFFTVMLPEDASRPRRENFEFMADGLRRLAPILEANDGRLVMEGWPGEGALCCTPETYRATFEAVGSMAIGINYDPSHLIRMGIDPIRFLREFKDRVYHVHGKDTQIFVDALYEYGTEQPSTFGAEHGFGAASWRYTIPGHGVASWTEILRILKDNGYDGFVSIELEDENFNGTDDGERAGFIASGQFLATA
jgi:sugar phosphate isomerase/epimerase